MAKLYWVTFRLKDNRTRDDRYDALMAAMRDCAGSKWWVEPTSFAVFQSDLGIDDLAAHLGAAIDEGVDVLLIGMPEVKSARVIGLVEDRDLFKIWPWVRHV